MSNEQSQAAVEAAAPIGRKRLPWGISASWGVGHMSISVGLAAINSQVLFFLTDFVGVKPVLAGTILALAKLSDIFTDVVVGFCSDHFNTRWGRRRPWVLAGAIVSALTVALLFNLNHVPEATTTWVCLGGLLIFYVGYTCIHVPLVAMSAEIVNGYKESAALWSWGAFFRQTGSSIFGIFGSAALIVLYGKGIKAYNGMGLTLGLVILAAGLAFFIGTRHAPRVAAVRAEKRPAPIREWLTTLLGNGSLMALVGFEVMCSLALSFLGVTMTYFLFDVMRVGQPGLMVFGTASLPTHILAMWLVVKLQIWLPKHILAAIGAIGTGAVALVLRTFNETTGLVAFGFLVATWGLFHMGRNIVSNAMVTDIIRVDTLRTGLRREGAIASMISAVEKTTPAIALTVFSYLLASSGYVAGSRGAGQPQKVIDMIYMINCVVPGILAISAAALILLFYKLNEARMQEIEAAAAKPA